MISNENTHTCAACQSKENIPTCTACQSKENIPTCTACQSKDLVHGKIQSQYDIVFMPGTKWFSWGYTVRAFVCLNCGYISQYLTQKELAALREKERR